MKAAPPTLAMERVYEKLRTLPGAESVAACSAPPVNGVVLPLALLNAEERTAVTSVYFLVTENFFATMRTPIVRGRDFTATDTASAPWVAIINETLAQRFWPGENPIGKHFNVDAVSGERARVVIGVVRDVPLQYVPTRPQPVAYTLYRQQPNKYEGWNAGMFGQMMLFIRSNRAPMSLVPAVRQAVYEVDPNRPPADFQTMTAFVGKGMRTRGFYVSMLGLFAFMATVLAAVSIYGVMTLSVFDRTGVTSTRMALGVRARDVVAAAGSRALRSVAIGLVSGIAGALVLTQWIESQLWGVTATDPATYATVAVLLVGVSFAACFIAARKANTGAEFSLRLVLPNPGTRSSRIQAPH
jgi:putative ABC transport system permease protein